MRPAEVRDTGTRASEAGVEPRPGAAHRERPDLDGAVPLRDIYRGLTF